MKLKNVIQINATPEIVWQVTEDVENWPQWAPTMQSVSRTEQGPFDVGSGAMIKQPGLPESKWVVTALAKGESFTWESRSCGMKMAATHEISTTSSAVRSTLRIEISGLVAVLLWPMLFLSVRRSLQKENFGLKNQCEAIHLSS